MKSWHLVTTKESLSDTAECNLGQQSFEVFNPKFETRIAEGDEIKVKYEPMFPGYMFVRFDSTKQSASLVNHSRGVKKLVSFGDVLAIFKDDLMDDLKHRMSELEPKTVGVGFLKEGAKVEITSGPLKGTSAIFQEMNGRKRSLLLISMLNGQQKVAVLNTHFS